MGITWKPVIAAHRFKELADGMGMMRPKKTCHKAMKATAMVSEVDFDMGDAGDDLPAPESEHLTTLIGTGTTCWPQHRLARATHRLSPRSIAEPLVPSPEHV